jgi:hypothetical protein
LTRADHRDDPLTAMRGANPVSAEGLRATLPSDALDEVLERIVANAEPPRTTGADSAPASADRSVPAPLRGRRLAFGLGGALACVAAIAALLLLGGSSVGGSGQPAFAAAAIEVAEANPRLLVTAPGWAVTDAGEFEADEGEIAFANGGRRFAIHWYPARFYRRYLHDRALVSKPRRSTLLGRTATTVRYGVDRSGAEEYATMLAPAGSVFVEVRGAIGDRAGYDAVLRSLRPVSVDAWLEAMPPSIVGPDARARVVERMLRGVPLPPGLDRAALQGEDSVLNHYQLAAKLAKAVSCGWVESWLAANRTRSEARADEAVAAMATWRHWSMMSTPAEKNPWSSNIKLAAHWLAAGHVDSGADGRVVNPDGSGYELGPAWATLLNCTNHIWRHPLQGGD